MQIQFPLILDGATGTELQKRGFTGDVSAEEWVLAHPEAIADIQRGYVQAGSQVLYCPSFGANRQKLEEHGIFNKTADYNRRLAELSKKAAAWTRLFSRREEVADGTFLRGDTIVLRHDGCEEAVMQISDIRLPGMHNVENYLAAVTALDGLVPYEVMRETARTFVGVEHRIEPVRTIRGVQW